MQEIEILIKEIGLNSNEIAIFNFLLNMPPQSASAISRNLNINRSSIYNLLTGLIDRGIVQQTPIENINYYSLRSINYIIQSIKYKKLDSIKNLSKIEQRIKKLNKVPIGIAFPPKFSVEKGKSAYLKVLEQLRNLENPLFAVISSSEIKDLITENVRIKEDIFNDKKPFKVLLGMPIDFEKIKYVKEKMRILPKEFDMGFDFFINENKLFIVSVLEEIVLTIESEALRRGFHKYFRFAWTISS